VTPLVEVIRSGYVESTHSGAVLALAPDGSIAWSVGDVDRLVYPRSSNKPLQAVGLLEAGWEPQDDRQLALACASHSGEPGHLEVVEAMLDGQESLGNPPGLPLSEAAAHALLASGGRATPLTQNCSGKHAAMLATCRVNDWPLADYLDPDHPVQVACRRAIERLAGEQVQRIAVDGCGAPQHALTLRGLARAFGVLARAFEGPDHRTAEAMRAHPWHVGGTGRDVTDLMVGIPGLVAKDGAEGVFAAGLPDGSCVALKVDDGAARARPPLMAAALRRLGVDAPVLDRLAVGEVHGGGRPVGEVRGISALL
jgi:L-asparaginase II